MGARTAEAAMNVWLYNTFGFPLGRRWDGLAVFVGLTEPWEW